MSFGECKICQYVKWAYLGKEKYNLSCQKTGKIVAENVYPNTCFDRPSDCPKYKTETKENTSSAPNVDTYTLWSRKKPTVKWEDIKPGNKYHIPPVNSMKRCNITVATVNDTYFTYYSDTKKMPEFMYKNYLAFKYMTKILND